LLDTQPKRVISDQRKRRLAMKKAFFAGIVVLAALTLITCDGFSPNDTSDGEKPELTYDESRSIQFKAEPYVFEDGTPGIQLTSGGGKNLTSGGGKSASRSMSASGAETWADYYEVAFMYETATVPSSVKTTYRAKWQKGEIGRIAVHFGTYSTQDPTSATGTTGAAIMFAGRYDTRTLLAIGTLSKVTYNDGSADGTNVINAATSSVTFTLVPLTADVAALPASDFKITQAGYLTSAETALTFPKVKVTHTINSVPEKIDAPLFMVGNGANSATYTIGGMTTAKFAGLILGTGTVTSSAASVSGGVGGFQLTGASTISMAGTGVITFSLVVPAAPITGLTWFTFDIPVRALVADVNGDQWHITGGLKGAEYDLGATNVLAKSALGGRILLGTGVDLSMAEFEVYSTFAP